MCILVYNETYHPLRAEPLRQYCRPNVCIAQHDIVTVLNSINRSLLIKVKLQHDAPCEILEVAETAMKMIVVVVVVVVVLL